MISRSSLIIAGLAALAALPALAQPAPAPPGPRASKPPGKELPPPPPRAATLDDLFERLVRTKDESEAKGITASIQRRWLRSGSDTADVLMSRAMQAVEAKDQALAIEILDRVVVLQPEWAEGWNKRATVFFMLGDVTRSMADIRETLAREPRHYGALAGLGIILQSNGDRKAAYDVFRKALALNPFLNDVKQQVQRLESELGDKDI
jgi:tetratricopeptide (TPR) repeat protein